MLNIVVFDVAVVLVTNMNVASGALQEGNRRGELRAGESHLYGDSASQHHPAEPFRGGVILQRLRGGGVESPAVAQPAYCCCSLFR